MKKVSITAQKNDLMARSSIAQALINGARAVIRTESFLQFAVDATGMLTTAKGFKSAFIDTDKALAMLWKYTASDENERYVFIASDGVVTFSDADTIVDKSECFWERQHPCMGKVSDRNPNNRAIYEWLRKGGLCTYRCGLKGARQGFITLSDAVQRLIKGKYSELEWECHDGKEVLCFQEYSGSDYD